MRGRLKAAAFYAEVALVTALVLWSPGPVIVGLLRRTAGQRHLGS